MPRGAKPMGKEMFIERARAVHGDTYDYSKVEYKNNRTPVEIICPEHGSFWQRPGEHLTRRRGCPKCRGGVRYTRDEFIEKARELFPDYDYSQVEYVNASTPVLITCPIHGEFEKKPVDVLRGHGCTQCGYRRRNTPDIVKRRTALAKASLFRRHGVTNPGLVPGAREKMTQTCLERFHATTYLGSEEKKSHNAEYMRRRIDEDGKPISRTEDILYDMLCDVYGKQDVIRQYRDEVRYPFCCDFYIKSQDMFIEFNAFMSHGDHWFDETSDGDQVLLEHWRSKAAAGFDMYSSAIYTWTDLDVRKRGFARKYGLCFAVFWDNKLSDAKAWIADGCPDRYDWM